MVRAAVRCADAGGRLLAVALIALAAHACAYGELAPPGHAYLAPYRLAVGLCTVAAIALMAGALGLAWASRRRPGLAALPRALFGRSVGQGDVTAHATALARDGLIVLCVQETLERSITLGVPAGPALSPAGWLAALIAAGLCALVIVLITRLCARAVHTALARLDGPGPGFGFPSRTAVPVAPALARRAPLAERRAMRAPPLLPG